jgi:putative transposase
MNLGDDVLIEGGVSRRVSSLPEPRERSDTPCREIPPSRSVSLKRSTIHLTEVAREGARRMLAQVLIAEADAFVAHLKDLKLPDGRDRVVRHGHGPQRTIQTGVGAVEMRRAKVRDRATWARRTKSASPRRSCRSLDALLPVPYLRGVSTGQETLTALLGKDAPNLSPAVVARLTAEWQTEYDAWQKRDLSARRYLYVWADGVYLQAQMEESAECMLVLIGPSPGGKRNSSAPDRGAREGAELA